MMRQSSSGSFSESLHAVVDHDGNHADGDGDGQTREPFPAKQTAISAAMSISAFVARH
jgi:hypothetical protein